ncbi:MAG: hypothetical protein BRC57_03430, partial [Cyanobacteria bacterium QS_8_48_54]
ENHHTITLPLLWFHYLKSAVIQLDNAKAHSAQILTVAKMWSCCFSLPTAGRSIRWSGLAAIKALATVATL